MYTENLCKVMKFLGNKHNMASGLSKDNGMHKTTAQTKFPQLLDTCSPVPGLCQASGVSLLCRTPTHRDTVRWIYFQKAISCFFKLQCF